MANNQLTICRIDAPVPEDTSPRSIFSNPSPSPASLNLLLPPPLPPSPAALLTNSTPHPPFSLKRCKDVLRFTRRVLRGFKSKNYTHSQHTLDRYLCTDRDCSCIGHYGQECVNDKCTCIRHIITLACGWFPEQCPAEKLGNYRGCKASGSLIDTNLHVCHRLCPFTVSNRKTGRSCSRSGCFYEEMELYAPDYTFKIDQDLIDRADADGNYENMDCGEDEDNYEDAMMTRGHRSDIPGAERSGVASSLTNIAGTVNQFEPTSKSVPRPSLQASFSSTSSSSGRQGAPSSSKSAGKASSRHRVFARTSWEAINKDLTGSMDCLRWNIISTAKSAIRLVMHTPHSISDEELTLLATVAASYYVDYRVGQDHSRHRQARALLSPGCDTSPGPGQGNARDLTSLYSASQAEKDHIGQLNRGADVANPSNLSNHLNNHLNNQPTSNPNSSSSSSYRKASVSVKRRSGMSRSVGSMGADTSAAVEDDGLGIEFAVASDRSTKQSNLKMFRYFVLAVVQGCLSNDVSFPHFDFMTLNSFMDMKQWSRVIGISNRRVTKYCTSISQSVEEGIIKTWRVGQSTGLRLPPEVLQWDDWIKSDE